MKAVVSVALAILLSGCSSSNGSSSDDGTGTEPPLTVDPYIQVRMLVEELPCDVSEVGTGTSENLQLLTKITPEWGGSKEIDIHDNMLAAAGGGGFQLFDITDPLNPVNLSINLEPNGDYDVKFSPDNRTVFVGLGGGIAIIDISNRTSPVMLPGWSFDDATVATDPPAGPRVRLNENAHMMYTKRINGEDWLFLAPNSNTGVWILRIEGDPGNRTLEYVTQSLPVEGGPLGPHDMYVQKDEIDGNWYLYSSDGYHGWTVFNVNDPANPELAGGIVRPETGYTHTIQAAKIGDRRIVATIAEVGANYLQVYDATDLQTPVLLASWQASPTGVAPQHNFNIVNGSLYLAHYANGIYIFDLTQLPDLPAIGTLDFGPQGHYSTGSESPISLFSHFWDILLLNGVLYGSSGADGIHVIGYGCLEPGDVTLTSTG